MKSALVLVPPNIPSMDSVAGGRFQATYNADGRRASHWIPIWICYAAGSVPTARAMDCNVEGLSREEFLRSVPDYDIYVFYANQETIGYDQETARLLHDSKKRSLIAFAGPYSTVLPERVLAEQGVDVVIRGEVEEALRALCDDWPLRDISGLSWKEGDRIVHNGEAAKLDDLDSLPWVSRIIRRDLPLLRYRIPYLNYPYISILSGRGCPGRCCYCLWPQTISGHRYRTRSIADVAEEMIWIHTMLPQVREIQIEDDTFTCDPGRVLELCDALRGRDITWSCCARPELRADVLHAMKQSGARNLVVGFESGSNEILQRARKGVRTQRARAFRDDCRRAGLRVHGCFVFGLPGETKETAKQTLDYALELAPDTVQFAIASAYEGTAFNDYLRDEGFLHRETGITSTGHLTARYDYPELSADEINRLTHQAWRTYYLRPATILRQLRGALTNLEDFRRLFHGVHYVGQYLFMNEPHAK